MLSNKFFGKNNALEDVIYKLTLKQSSKITNH